MKPRKSDLYDYATTKAHLALNVINAYSLLFDYCYYITFKRTLKEYKEEFSDPYEQPIWDLDFFTDVDDAYVQQLSKISGILVEYSADFLFRNGMDDEKVQNLFDEEQALRYAPANRHYIYKKGYRQLLIDTHQYIESVIETLYLYACAITMESYQLPKYMRCKVVYTLDESLRFLNLENYEVNTLTELILILDNEKEKLKRKK
ncbi:MAG: hypothetical protein EOO90_19760 [Pedobacter sp.]|nr:MAG: hypothetical protein EOO90_19760 [Pedobacter sp.]